MLLICCVSVLLYPKKLKLPDFETWVNSELNGYDTPADVPKYRIINCTLHLHNPYNGLIPLHIEDAKIDKILYQYTYCAICW